MVDAPSTSSSPRRPGRSLFGHRYRQLCRGALLLTLFLTLLFNGSVSPPYKNLSGSLTVVLVLLCWPIPVTDPEIRRLRNASLVILGFAALWVLVQSLPLPLWAPVHPVWREVAPVLDLETGAISVAPAHTRMALPGLILPGLVFVSMLTLCQSISAAKRVWTALALLGAVLVALAILLEVAFPKAHFFTTYEVGYGSFSGFLVNRNTAASFFGLAAFALAGAAMMPQRSHRSPIRMTPRVVLLWLAVFATMIAVIATRSRAGTLLSLPLLTLCLAIAYAQASRHRRGVTRGLTILGVGLVVLVLFGEPVFSRLGNAGQDYRWCAWANTLAALRDHPWLGTGFGSFVDVFPAYRDPACLGTEGTWTRAHNSFLELALGLGLPATGLILGASYRILLSCCFTGVRRRRSLRAIPLLTLGALVFVSAHSLVDFPLQIPGVALYCAALLGTGCALSVLDRQWRGSSSS